MSINSVIGILSSPVPSTASSSPIPSSPVPSTASSSPIPSSPVPSTASSSLIPSSPVSSTYLTRLLPDDVLLIIASLAGPSFIIKLAITSKPIYESLDRMVRYFMSSISKIYKNITSPIKSYLGLSWSLIFSNAIRHEDISIAKHIISLGVDINYNYPIKTIRINRIDRSVTIYDPIHHNIDIYPIHYAIYSNDPAKLRLLLDHGAIIPPLTKYSLHDLLSHTHHKILGSRIEVNKEIPEIILNEYIKKEIFPYFLIVNGLQINVFLNGFVIYCLLYQEDLETGHNIPKSCENIRICNNIRCRKLSDNLRICNGLFLCEECTTSREGPGQEPLNESNYIDKLWEEPYSADHYLCYPKFIDEEDDQDDWYVSDH